MSLLVDGNSYRTLLATKGGSPEAENRLCEAHLELALLRAVLSIIHVPADLATIWPALEQLLDPCAEPIKLSNHTHVPDHPPPTRVNFTRPLILLAFDSGMM